MLIVDTGPLVAAADRADKDHVACQALLEDDEGPLVTTGPLIAEVGYLINRQLGPAERHGAIRVATLDRRHFTVVGPRHAQALELLP